MAFMDESQWTKGMTKGPPSLRGERSPGDCFNCLPWPTDTSIPVILIVSGLSAIMLHHVYTDWYRIAHLPKVLGSFFETVKRNVLSKEIHPEMKNRPDAQAKMAEIKAKTALRVSLVAGNVWLCVGIVQLVMVACYGVGEYENKQQFLLVNTCMYGICRYVQLQGEAVTATQVNRAMNAAYLTLAFRMFTFPNGNIYFMSRTVCTTMRIIVGFPLMDHQISAFWNLICTTGSFMQYLVTADALGTDRLPGHLLIYLIFELLAVITLWSCHYYVQMFVEGWAISLADAEEMPNSHKLIRKMMSVLCDVDFILDEDLRFTDANSKLTHFFRSTPADLKQARFTDFLDSKPKAMFRKFESMGVTAIRECAPGIDVLAKTTPACLNLHGKDAQDHDLSMCVLYVCFPMRGRPAHYIGVREKGSRPELSGQGGEEREKADVMSSNERALGKLASLVGEDVELATISDSSRSGSRRGSEIPAEGLESINITFNPFASGKEMRKMTLTFVTGQGISHQISMLKNWMTKGMYQKFDDYLKSFISNAANDSIPLKDPIKAFAMHHPVSSGSLVARSVSVELADEPEKESDCEGDMEDEDEDDEENMWLEMNLSDFTSVRLKQHGTNMHKDDASSCSSGSSMRSRRAHRRPTAGGGTPSSRCYESFKSPSDSD